MLRQASKCFKLPARFSEFIGAELDGIKKAGTWKNERIITTPQSSQIKTTAGATVINMCANNYLGLADNSRVIAAARKALDDFGFGCASVRFICGTMTVHKDLEKTISSFHGTADTILYSSCFDANAGLFETLLTAEDAIISDELNHASIIDGVRLSKAQRFRYKNSDMADLEAQLQAAASARVRMIATDGIFSMDGYVAKLPEIVALAERYDALVMVDDSHATGYFGPTGRGSMEHHGVMDKIDIITSTLGKALGGGSGGYTTSLHQPVIDMLRNRSRPYLFSNSIPPPNAAAAAEVFKMLSEDSTLPAATMRKANYFKDKMAKLGFTILKGDTAIVPVMLGDAALAARFAEAMLAKGVYVVAFSFPVVPKGKARIRVQVSGAHTEKDLDTAVAAFEAVGKDLGVIQ